MDEIHVRGDVYETGGEKYILAWFEINQKWYAVLISMEDGNRWRTPTPVKSTRSISTSEWDEITRNERFEFIKASKWRIKEQIEEKKEEEPEAPEDEEVNEEGIMQLAELFEEDEDG